MKSYMTFEDDRKREAYHLKMMALKDYAKYKLDAYFPSTYDHRFSPQIVMFAGGMSYVFTDIHHFEAWLQGKEFDPLTHSNKMYQARRAFEDNMTNYIQD